MITIHLSNRYIRVVDGSVKGRSITVNGMYCVEDTGGCLLNGMVQDEEGFARLIEGLWEKHQLPRKNVRLVVDSSQFTTKILELPKQTEKQLMQFVTREFSDVERIEDPLYGYFPLQNVKEKPLKEAKEKAPKSGKGFQLNMKIKLEKKSKVERLAQKQEQKAQKAEKAEKAPKEAKTVTVFAGMVSRQYVQGYLDRFEKLGISVSSVESARGAILRLLETLRFVQGKSCIVQIVDDMTLLDLLVIRGKFQYFSRKRLFSDRDTVGFSVEIARSLENILQFAQAHNFTDAIEQVFLAGLESDEMEIYTDSVEQINAAMTVEPLRVESGVQVNRAPESGESVSQYAIGIGALLPANPRTSIMSQLVQRPEMDEKTKKRRKIVIPVAALGVVLAGVAGFLGFRVFDLTRQLKLVEEYNNRPEVISAVAKYDAASQEIQSVSALYNGLTGLKAGVLSYPKVDSRMEQVVNRCASGLVTAVISGYSSTTGELSFQTSADSEQPINQFIALLKQEKTFALVDYTGYTQDSTGKWTVKVTCTVAGRQEENHDTEAN
ncbi:MAG: hypothetical protein PUC32_07950 [Oscillospiraceae bacterium]|nr:hypothetical protein [Oscillospiraceae bacterium]